MPPSASAGSRAAIILEAPSLACPAALVGLWREGAHIDLHLVAGGQRFGAHRIVLAAGSLYLKARLSGEWADSRAEVTLDADGVSAATLEAVLEFLYTGTCAVATEGGLPPLLAAACFLQVDALRDAAAAALAARLTTEGCLDAWELGERYGLAALAEAAAQHARCHFGALVPTPAFAALPAPRLEALLADDWLHVPGEEAVLDALSCWHAAAAPPPGEADVTRLLSHIRFPLIPREVARQALASSALLSSEAALRTVALAYASDGAARRPRLGGLKLYMMGRCGDSSHVGTEVFDPQRGAWAAGPPLPAARLYFGLVALAGKLYAVGGCDESGCALSAVEVFDPQRSMWDAGSPTAEARSWVALAAA